MERQDYPAILPSLQPEMAVNVLNDRVRQVGALNTAIADWLQERRRLEDEYANGLRRLARRNIEGADLGIFSVQWDALKSAVEGVADSHTGLAAKIETDVEQPLRSFASTSREMQNISTVQGNLAAMAKEVDRARQKVERLAEKGDRADASKFASASSDLDHAIAQWESQAPYIFEQLQGVDETRLGHVRDMLTQFQTHEMDQLEKDRAIAEQCLNILLNVEIADEIKTWALKTVSGQTRIPTQSVQRPAGRPAAVAATTSEAGSSSRPSAVPRKPSINSEEGDGASSSKRFSKLKRLSTVMGGKRKESKTATVLSSTPESPERRSRGLKFGSRGKRKDSSVSLDARSETEDRARTPVRRAGSSVLGSTIENREPAPPVPALPSPVEYLNGASSAPTGYISELPAINGGRSGELGDLESPRREEHESAAPVVEQPAGENDRPPQMDPITAAQLEAGHAGEDSPATPQYNLNIRDVPIKDDGGQDADAAMAAMAARLQIEAPAVASNRNSIVRGRRGDRNSIAMMPAPSPSLPVPLPPLPIRGRSQDAERNAGTPSSPSGLFPVRSPNAIRDSFQTATSQVTSSPTTDTSDVATPTKATSPGSQFSPVMPTPFTPTAAGMDVGANGGSVAGLGLSEDSPSTLRSSTRTAVPEHPDNQSIRSGRSSVTTAATGQGQNRHPELNALGLSASIIETVSARFEGNKNVAPTLVGELALAFHPPELMSQFGTENIKLENFATLEKVAPNPAFATARPEREGEYTIKLDLLNRTQVAFKYQIGNESANVSAPLLVTVASRIEPTQTSVIVSYSINPALTSSSGSLTLSNVMLALTLEGSKATSCQSRPVGTFSHQRNMIYWQLGGITVTSGASPQKLLARFATESEAKGGLVETKWEIAGEQASSLGSSLAISSPAHSAGPDPFADEEVLGNTHWKPVNTVKKLTSGSYVSKSS